MAIDAEIARFLLSCSRRGVSFGSCITLGRQHFHLSHTETRGVLREFGMDPAGCAELFGPEYPMYAEPFWKALGARRIETMDASDFEGASIIHDLNKPVPESLKGQFDVVCDAGTLEHIFDFTGGIRNCMEMIREGGSFVAATPANNYFGHGFYQFSPELFFRVLSPANGFRVERMVAVEYGARRRWHEVIDPAEARARGMVINSRPVLLFVHAVKTRAVERLLAEPPQQSDYVATWAKSGSLEDGGNASPLCREASWLRKTKRWLIEVMPGLVRGGEGLLYSGWNRVYSFRNRRSFRPGDKRR